jgi:Tfp pilus assembly protein PilO
MNEKINTDLKFLNMIFNKNKSYIFPIVTVLVSIILFFQFVIPQVNLLLKARKEARESSLRLEALKENLNVLTNVDEEILDSQLKILSLALPLSKDFSGILNSIYSTAQNTGVNLGSFSFRLGDLAQSENSDNFPVVKLLAPISAGVTKINNFVEAISKTFPLAEAYSVKVENISSTVSLSFYYKPLNASNYSQDVRIRPISQKGLTLINQLGGFKNASSAAQ